MLKRLISTTCFALLASSALAADPALPVEEVATRTVSGYGQIYVGGVWVDFYGESESALSVGGAGQVNVPFADNWNVQGGLYLDAISDDGYTLYGYGGEAHLFWRDPASYAVGGFAEIRSYDSGDGMIGDVWDWKIGPEAQVYFDRVTLYAQAFYGQFEIDGAPFDVEQWGIRGVARYFVQDNLRLDAELGFHRSFVDEVDEDLDTVSLALQAMYRFTDTPVSLFGRYQFDRIDYSGIDVDYHKAVVGLRFSFGSSTLIDEDRNGATMDTWRPNFIRPLL